MITVFRPDPHVPVDRFEDWLSDAGQELEIIELWQDAVPQLANCGEGILIMGGIMDALDETRSPWLPALRALIQEAVDAEKPLLGICLGHQILAHSLGGILTINDQDGGEEGAYAIQLTEAGKQDELLGALTPLLDENDAVLMPESHHDVVSELPHGAVLLARSDMYTNQAFRYKTAVGVQFHPEASPETVGHWNSLYGGNSAALVARMQEVDEHIIPGGKALAEAFARLVSTQETQQA